MNLNWSDLFFKKWAETGFILLILVGFFIAISIQSVWIGYLVVILSGLMAGRVWFEKWNTQPIFPFFLIIAGFLLGYMLGAFILNKVAIVIIFLLSWILSYQLHEKGYIP